TSESKEIPIRLSVGIIATRNPFAINPNTGNYTILLSEIQSRPTSVSSTNIRKVFAC
ncbi:unnamed protein product, partial [Rotaria sp. Silwood1]